MARPSGSPSYYTLTEAVVLSTAVIGESDALVNLFTRRAGRVRAVAKGGMRSLKRFMNCLDAFGRITVALEDKAGRDLARIDSCSLDRRPELAADPVRFGLAGLMVELVLIFCPERQPDPDVFTALSAALDELPDHAEPVGLSLAFGLRLLSAAGFGPNLEGCLGCGAALSQIKKPGLDMNRGGLVCQDCGPAAGISKGAAKTIRLCQTIDPAALGRVRFPAKELGRLFALFARWLTHHAEREIKSLGFLSQLGMKV